jgi:adhesin HecA-like repeat protein
MEQSLIHLKGSKSEPEFASDVGGSFFLGKSLTVTGQSLDNTASFGGNASDQSDGGGEDEKVRC